MNNCIFYLYHYMTSLCNHFIYIISYVTVIFPFEFGNELFYLKYYFFFLCDIFFLPLSILSTYTIARTCNTLDVSPSNFVLSLNHW